VQILSTSRQDCRLVNAAVSAMILLIMLLPDVCMVMFESFIRWHRERGGYKGSNLVGKPAALERFSSVTVAHSSQNESLGEPFNANQALLTDLVQLILFLLLRRILLMIL
jgi:hypothetical protein